MRNRPGRGLPLVLAVPFGVGVVAALLGAMPSAAAPAPGPTNSGSGPVTVVIPGSSSPSPSSSHGGSGGGSNGGGGGSSGGGGGTGGGGGAESCAKNTDGSPVAADQPQSDAPKLKLDSAIVEAGDWAVAVATGYQAGEKAQLVIYPGKTVLGSFTAGNDGSVTAQFRVPAESRTGGATVETTGWETCHRANAALTVVGASVPANWLSLWWVYIVLGILVIALASLAIAFRRELAGMFGGTAKGTA